MRRRLRKFLPVLLTALAAQMLAQIGACWAAALAVPDPLASLPICHGSAQAAPAGSDQGSDSGQDGSCAMCCVLNASASIDTPRQATLVTPLYLRVKSSRGLMSTPISSQRASAPTLWLAVRRRRSDATTKTICRQFVTSDRVVSIQSAFTEHQP
jgi:hypothetical protein